MMPKTIQTMAQAYQQICAGEDPWTALGNFKNAWYDYARDNRAALVRDPLDKPELDIEHTSIGPPFARPRSISSVSTMGYPAQRGYLNLPIPSPPLV